jgi:hypothetical protein
MSISTTIYKVAKLFQIIFFSFEWVMILVYMIYRLGDLKPQYNRFMCFMIFQVPLKKTPKKFIKNP